MIFYGARPDEALGAMTSNAKLAAAGSSTIRAWRAEGKIGAEAMPTMKAAWTLSLPASKTDMGYVYLMPQSQHRTRDASGTWEQLHALL
jgi:hypothetical protein